jgi:hypothetical protein
MTELFIDGVRVVLPSDFSFTYTAENPFITKSGEYTLDVTLSLDPSTNARLYRHFGRFNSGVLFTGRRAVLVVNNKVIINGTEVILKPRTTNNTVVIQLVSGNSELNINTKNSDNTEKKIWELDLGTVPTITSEQVEATLIRVTGEADPPFDYTCCHVRVDDITYNEFDFYYVHEGNGGYYRREYKNIVPQLYFWALVKKVITAMGYTMIYNDLQYDPRFAHTVVFNYMSTDKWTDSLPDWTIADFLTEIEKVTGCVFIVESISKTVRLLKLNRTSLSIPTVYIENALDEYDHESSSENKLDSLSYDNVEYNLPTSTYYEYAKFNDNVLTYKDKVDFADFTALKNTVLAGVESYREKVPFSTASQSFYIIDKLNNSDYLRRCNIFRSFVKSKTGNTISLNIIPAEIITYPFDDPITQYPAMFTLPYISVNYADFSTDNITLIEYIEGESNKVNRFDKLFVFIYLGVLPAKTPTGADFIYTGNYYLEMDWSQNDSFIPTSFANSRFYIKNAEVKPGVYNSGNQYYIPNIEKYNLRLDGDNGMYADYYAAIPNIDVSQKYTIEFPANQLPDPRADFVINNRKFICEKIEYAITPDGFDTMAKGYFYPKA